MSELVDHFAELSAKFEKHLSTFVDDAGGNADLLRDAMDGGHRTRPVCCFLACEAAGGDADRALDFALAVELTHKASVIRDDIADGDDLRDGRPSFHARHGIPVALAVSDVLWSAAVPRLSHYPAAVGRPLAELLAETHHRMSVGQLADLAPLADTVPGGLDGALLVNRLKTGSLVESSFRGGAMCGKEPHVVEPLARYGRHVGSAFQLVNDIGNFVGSAWHVDRRGVDNTDIRGRRRGVLYRYAVANLPADRARELEDAFDRDDAPDEAALSRIRTLIVDSGAVAYADDLVERLLDQARQCVARLPGTPARDLLIAFCRSATLRGLVF